MRQYPPRCLATRRGPADRTGRRGRRGASGSRPWHARVALVLALASALVVGAGRVRAQVRIDVNRPRNAFDCELPLGAEWYGSRERCLRELCAGENVTNRYIVDRTGDLRRNPCYGEEPSALDYDR